MRGSRVVAVIVSLVGAVSLSRGHDFWIEPAMKEAPAATILEITLKVGEHLEGEIVPRDPQRFSSFQVSGPAGTLDVAGRDGSAVAGYARAATPGDYVVGYRSRPKSIVIDPATFESYLREMGLDGIIEARSARRHADIPGREVYSRCAKSIARTGGRSDGGFGRILGHTLEIVPGTDPLDPLADGFDFTLLHEGKPAPGVLVSVITTASTASRRAVRTDAGGRGRLPLDPLGFHLVQAVRMGPAPSGSGSDWESLWASLSFRRGGPSIPPPR